MRWSSSTPFPAVISIEHTDSDIDVGLAQNLHGRLGDYRQQHIKLVIVHSRKEALAADAGLRMEHGLGKP